MYFEPNIKIIVDCGIHAREWASFAFCQHFIYHLLWGDYQSWRDNINWVVYPAFNPDGYVYSWTDYRYQRKNRSPNPGSNCKQSCKIAYPSVSRKIGNLKIENKNGYFMKISKLKQI